MWFAVSVCYESVWLFYPMGYGYYTVESKLILSKRHGIWDRLTRHKILPFWLVCFLYTYIWIANVNPHFTSALLHPHSDIAFFKQPPSTAVRASLTYPFCAHVRYDVKWSHHLHFCRHLLTFHSVILIFPAVVFMLLNAMPI